MRLTSATASAVRALLYLARHPGDRLVTAETIAAAEGLSEIYLRKVLKPLASAGVLRSVMGPGGGYRLARPARRISLLDVVEAVDGLVCLDVPRWESGTSGVRLDAQLQLVCDGVAEGVRRQLRRVTLAELADEG
jgi:Rrf2 family protein